MKSKARRIVYLLLVLIVMVLGLLSRKFTNYIPDIINVFLGDSLWAVMIYFMVRMVFINSPIRKAVIISVVFCFSIEFSQLYHAEWIDAIRRTTLGGLVLGYGFLWSDLWAYLLGIGIGASIENILKQK